MCFFFDKIAFIANGLLHVRFHSCHIVHIKHNGTKFQMSNECLPTQFLQPNKRSMTFSVTSIGSEKIRRQSSRSQTQQYSVKMDDPPSPHYTYTYVPHCQHISMLNEIIICQDLPPSRGPVCVSLSSIRSLLSSNILA